MNAGLRNIALVGFVVLMVLGIGFWQVMPTVTHEGYQPDQPIPFNHKKHATLYKMECRYCHSSAYKSAHAGVPSLSTCMNCHSVVKTDSPYIQKMQKLYAEGKPVEWVRIHELPDHAHFNHKRHLAKGVQCETCHGNVKEMEKVYQDQPMNMGWCLNCHRGFETPKYLRKKLNQAPDSKEPVAPFTCNTCHY